MREEGSVADSERGNEGGKWGSEGGRGVGDKGRELGGWRKNRLSIACRQSLFNRHKQTLTDKHEQNKQTRKQTSKQTNKQTNKPNKKTNKQKCTYS